MEVVRMDEETALKAAGCKSFGGSIPFASAVRVEYWRIPGLGWFDSISHQLTTDKDW